MKRKMDLLFSIDRLLFFSLLFGTSVLYRSGIFVFFCSFYYWKGSDVTLLFSHNRMGIPFLFRRWNRVYWPSILIIVTMITLIPNGQPYMCTCEFLLPILLCVFCFSPINRKKKRVRQLNSPHCPHSPTMTISRPFLTIKHWHTTKILPEVKQQKYTYT